MTAQLVLVQAALIRNGSLRQVIDLDGERVLRCSHCQGLDGHAPMCPIAVRLAVAARRSTAWVPS